MEISIVHFESAVKDEIRLLQDKGFQNLKNVVKTKLTFMSPQHRHVTSNLPKSVEKKKHTDDVTSCSPI